MPFGNACHRLVSPVLSTPPDRTFVAISAANVVRPFLSGFASTRFMGSFSPFTVTHWVQSVFHYPYNKLVRWATAARSIYCHLLAVRLFLPQNIRWVSVSHPVGTALVSPGLSSQAWSSAHTAISSDVRNESIYNPSTILHPPWRSRRVTLPFSPLQPVKL